MLMELLERYQTIPSAGQRRAIGLNLVVFFLFALVAVALLTRTAVAANAINRDVRQAIVPVTASIDQDLKGLPILDKTGQLTSQIAAAAKPLPGEVAGVVKATDHINANLASTDKHVTSIGNAVDEIKASTGVIKPGIAQINGSVDTIHSEAASIAERLGGVATSTTTDVANLNGAGGSLTDVLNAVAPIHNGVKDIIASALSIDGHTAAIASSPLLLNSLGLNSALSGTPSPAASQGPAAASTGGSSGATTAPSTASGGGIPTLVNNPLQLLPLLGNLLGGL